MPRQPNRQVNVEVVRAIFSITTRQIGQRAAPPVPYEHRALHQHQPHQNPRPPKLLPRASNRNRHNAARKEDPNEGMDDLDAHQGRNSLALRVHASYQCSRKAIPLDGTILGWD